MGTIDPHQPPDHLEKWFEFTQRLYSTLDVDEASRIALDIALQLTGMYRGMLLTQEADGTFRFRYAQNKEGRTLRQEQFPDSTAILSETCKQVQAVFRSQDIAGSKSAICLPIISEIFSSNKVVGVVYCDSPQTQAYGPREQERIDLFLMHASPALESVILYDWATRDSMTRVYLRHYFDSMSQIEWRRTLRHKHPLTILRIDVDQLREFNEIYGKADGDMVLIKTAEILTEICRAEDLIARYDVDEFALLLPETDTAGAKLVGGRIIEEVPLLLTRDPQKPVTVSIGGATYPRCSTNSISDLMKLADSALTQAKQAGGKRAIMYEPSLSSAHRKLF